MLPLVAGCFGEDLPPDTLHEHSSPSGEAGADPTQQSSPAPVRNQPAIYASDNPAIRASDDAGSVTSEGGGASLPTQAPAGQDAGVTVDADSAEAALAADGPPNVDQATIPTVPAMHMCSRATGSSCGPCGATVNCDGSCSPPTCPIAIVQLLTAYCQGVTPSLDVPITKAQKAGDLIVIAVGTRDGTSVVQSVTDSFRNTYQLAIGPTRQGYDLSQSIYFASGIADALAGNVITINFLQTANSPEVRGAVYSGLNAVRPLDGVSAATGVSATPDSGSLATTTSRELLFAAGMTTDVFASPGPGFRSLAVVFGDIAEDRVVSVPGAFSAGGSFNRPPASWIMQLAAFH
jgi:hypothetical protein